MEGKNKLFPKKTNSQGYSHKNSKRDGVIKESWIFVFESKKCTDGALVTLPFDPSWVCHTKLTLKMRIARSLTFFLPLVSWSRKCFQKHSWAFLKTSSPSINLRCPKSGITLKWLAFLKLPSSLSYPQPLLPFPKRPGDKRNESVSLNLIIIIF